MLKVLRMDFCDNLKKAALCGHRTGQCNRPQLAGEWGTGNNYSGVRNCGRVEHLEGEKTVIVGEHYVNVKLSVSLLL